MSFWDNVKKFAQPYSDEEYDDYDEDDYMEDYEEPVQQTPSRRRRPVAAPVVEDEDDAFSGFSAPASAPAPAPAAPVPPPPVPSVPRFHKFDKVCRLHPDSDRRPAGTAPAPHLPADLDSCCMTADPRSGHSCCHSHR